MSRKSALLALAAWVLTAVAAHPYGVGFGPRAEGQTAPEVETAATPETQRPLSNPNGVVVQLTDTWKDGDSTVLFFEFTNNGTKSIWYSGYSQSNPRRQIDKLIPGGWLAPARWEEWSADWCGTGAGYYEIAPGKSISFRQAVRTRAAPMLRVGVFLKGDGASESGIAWSARVHPGR
jgi:hypothetical protein